MFTLYLIFTLYKSFQQNESKQDTCWSDEIISNKPYKSLLETNDIFYMDVCSKEENGYEMKQNKKI